MTKLKGILLTQGMHGMISQVEGLDRKPTTIVLSGVTKSDAGSKKSVLNGSEWN